MATIIYPVNPATLAGFADKTLELLNQKKFLLSNFLPNADNPGGGIDWKTSGARLARPNSAKFRAWDATVGKLNRQAFHSVAGELAAVGVSMPLTEEQAIRLRSGSAVSQEAAIEKAIFNDTGTIVMSIAQRAELARGETLATAGMAVNENGFVDGVDFGRDVSMEPTAIIPWTTATVATMTPLTDEVNAYNAYVDRNGFEPAVCVMPLALRRLLPYSAQYRQRVVDLMGMSPSVLTDELVDRVRAANHLPPIVTYDVKVPVDGVEVRTTPANVVMYMPPADRKAGVLLHGVTQEALDLRDAGYLSGEDMPRITIVNSQEGPPVQKSTYGGAIFFPVMPEPDHVLALTVFP